MVNYPEKPVAKVDRPLRYDQKVSKLLFNFKQANFSIYKITSIVFSSNSK